MDITSLPFNALVGIERAGDGVGLLRLPRSPQYLNHVGTVHAGALLALAEASSGEFLIRHFSSPEGILPVVRRLKAKFRKPANGTVRSSAEATPEALEKLKAELSSRHRSIISVFVELYDESEAHVLSAIVEWFVQQQQPSAMDASS